MTRKSLMGFFSRESRLALTLFCSSADMRCGGRPGLQPPAGDRGLSRRQTPQEVPGYRITSFLASWSPRCVVKSARRSACLRLPGHYPLEECACVCARARAHACSVAQSCPALCDPMDYGPPGSSTDGIFQARILEWAAISSSTQHLSSVPLTPAPTWAGERLRSEAQACRGQPRGQSVGQPRVLCVPGVFSNLSELWNFPLRSGAAHRRPCPRACLVLFLHSWARDLPGTGSSRPGDRTCMSCLSRIAGRFFPLCHLGAASSTSGCVGPWMVTCWQGWGAPGRGVPVDSGLH